MRGAAGLVAVPPSILSVSRTIPAGMGSNLDLRMEGDMKIKTKIVNLAAIPLILVVCIMNASSYWTGLSLLEQEQAQMEKDLLQEKQQLLDRYLKLAESAIAKNYTAEDTPANREAVKSILRDLRYAEGLRRAELEFRLTGSLARLICLKQSHSRRHELDNRPRIRRADVSLFLD